MASTFLRKDSSFVWVRFKDEEGKWQSKATQYRKGNFGDVRQAELMAREMSREERSRRQAKSTERWGDWVDGWLADQHAGKSTLRIYQVHWWNLLTWLTEQGLNAPLQMSYRAAMEYRAARMAAGASNNYVIMELKLLSRIMNEAVRRGFAQGNPLLRMGLKKDPAKEKVPWTDANIELVAKRIKKQPEWMRVTFLLGLYQAARMRQCAIPLKDIDVQDGWISYWRTVDGKPLVKGDKPFTQPIDARLLPELRKIVAARKKAKHKSLCDIPAFGASLEWRRFLDGLGLTKLSHHGLRVTWITRAAKSGRDGKRGVFLAEAKRFVNHGSTSVHEIYQRLNADDISHVPAAMQLPALR